MVAIFRVILQTVISLICCLLEDRGRQTESTRHIQEEAVRNHCRNSVQSCPWWYNSRQNTDLTRPILSNAVSSEPHASYIWQTITTALYNNLHGCTCYWHMDDWGPQFSMGRGISSQAVEFFLCCRILIFPSNFAEVEYNSPTIRTIFDLMTYFWYEKITLNCQKLWALLTLSQYCTIVNKCNATWQITVFEQNNTGNFLCTVLA